jgi:hypothetical protein
MLLVNSGFHTRKRNYPRISSKLLMGLHNVSPACPRPKKFQEHLYEGALSISLPRGAHLSDARSVSWAAVSEAWLFNPFPNRSFLRSYEHCE